MPIKPVDIWHHSLSMMVIFCTVLHISWSLLILKNHASVNATALHALFRFITSFELLPFVLFAASVSAVTGLAAKGPWKILLLIPQQILLMMSTAGCISAMWLSHFADGVPRDSEFIISDQIIIVIATLCYSIAMFSYIRRSRLDG